MRKTLVGLSLALLLAAGVARAAEDAEAIPADVIQQVVPFASQIIEQQFPNRPVKVEPQLEKTTGFHVKETMAVVVMPDKNVTVKSVEAAGDKSVPVGVIATKSLSLQIDDKILGADKIAVADLNGVAKLPVFFLAAHGTGDKLVMEVYSKEGKPLISVPLKKQSGDAANSVSIKLANIDTEKKKLDLLVNVGGAYEATVKLGFLDI